MRGDEGLGVRGWGLGIRKENERHERSETRRIGPEAGGDRRPVEARLQWLYGLLWDAREYVAETARQFPASRAALDLALISIDNAMGDVEAAKMDARKQEATR